MHTAACRTRSPAYRHRTNTATARTARTEMDTTNESPPFQKAPLVAGECAVRLAARPAATCNALLAHRVAIGGQRAADAGAALAAAGQAGMHHLITYFPSEQVKPPFRESKVRSATVPGTIGTGNLMVPAGPSRGF